MANENDIAILTDRVAQAMQRARVTLDNSVDALSDENFGRLLDHRVEDIRALTDVAAPVQEAEFEAEVQRRLADRTQDPRDADNAREARSDVMRPFTNAQEEGQQFVRRVNAAQEQLAEFHHDLGVSGAGLDQALNDLDTLRTFPESRESADELRTRVNHLRDLTVNAYQGVQTASNHLENAKGAAQAFGRSDMGVDKYRLSTAIRETGAELQGDVAKTREGLGTVRNDLAAEMPEVHESAEYGYRQAELADAMRAGMNPTPRAEQTGGQETEAGNGEQDPRLRAAQQASHFSNEL
ncbi:hypothetical protein [Kribbella speibonae]|uniref:Uncharacterized protein n=1 Tax=Kribbella speibonae TaxID=1572660 RepID=A0A4R0J2X5_9ACTN|nr:hypothetical protein [Kribbella speibonae]TCC23407.1 hypothetical protein E0H58_16610 [Kribbella speibonae]TCC38546.1 hypothetical protein E0H92_19195 [Kribbella speibonae]